MAVDSRLTPTGSSHWHSIDWNAVLAGERTADRYFARPGLIRKDRLARFVPPPHHPETSPPFDSFDGLVRVLVAFGVSAATSVDSECRSSISFVLKKAHSSNANGIRFLSGEDAWRLCSRSRSSPVMGCGAVLACVGAVSAAIMYRRDRKFQGIAAAFVAIVAGSSTIAIIGKAAKRKAFVEEVQRSFTAHGNEPVEKRTTWILQRHVDSVLLSGRKFHLRALFLCIGDLKAFVHTDVRALLATEPYESARVDGGRLRAHVTNMGVQQMMDTTGDYDHALQNTKLSALADVGWNESHVFDSICRILGETLSRVRACDRRQFFSLPNCWELFGADFLLEAGTNRVLLLELNPSPSMSMYGDSSEARALLLGSDPLQNLEEPGWRCCFPLDKMFASASIAQAR
eukprot:TRINITY_DN74593_c0_g1_i1.p1 TRINITY_DN74593_c0_g1~~TRINITY_DN74593_c0_g1_i1.p1  ORF type:complete len:401 (+),score=46.24 TRINITY_DN74593_c0_g1_i1:214-1416(+)